MGRGTESSASHAATLLTDLRRAAGLTQEELAERSGMSIRGIRKLEAGLVARPRGSSLEALAAGLGLSDADRQLFVHHHRGLLAAPSTLGRAHTRGVPRQLPPPPRDLVGREAELEELDQLTSSPNGTAIVIAGTAGIGKTALATWWGHQVADRFPDGQLFVNLRGFDPGGEPLSPATALHGFLTALGQRPDGLPQSLDDRAALFRSLTADRRILVVLDNARDVQQVRYLLPATSGCLTLVTSRNQLMGLVAEQGASSISLDVLTEDAAVALLESRLGSNQATLEPDALSTLSNYCARLPLAIVVAAARAAGDPGRVDAVLHDLRRSRSRLDALDTSDPLTTVRSVFESSYDALDARCKRTFRLLGLHTGPDIDSYAVAALTDCGLERTERILRALYRAHLVHEEAEGRYTMHDLLRAYAVDRLEDIESDSSQQSAMRRMLDHYLQSAYQAWTVLTPRRDALTLPPRLGRIRLSDISSPAAAKEWWIAEFLNITAAIESAEAADEDVYAWQLADLAARFADVQGRWHEAITLELRALPPVKRLADGAALSRVYRALAYFNGRAGAHAEAEVHLRSALETHRAESDRRGLAQTLAVGAALRHGLRQNRQAVAYATNAARLFSAGGHSAGQAQMLAAGGWYHAQLGDWTSAVNMSEEAVAAAVDAGDLNTQASAYHTLGYVERARRSTDKSIHWYQQALDLYITCGSRFTTAKTHSDLGDVYADAGDFSTAKECWTAAHSIYQELNHPNAEDVQAKLADLD